MANREPKIFKDVVSIIFGPRVSALIKSGEQDKVVSLVSKWIFSCTRETSGPVWLDEAMEAYFKDNDMKVVLSSTSADVDKKSRQHSVKRLAKKLATDSKYAMFQKKQPLAPPHGFGLRIYRDGKMGKGVTFPDDLGC